MDFLDLIAFLSCRSTSESEPMVASMTNNQTTITKVSGEQVESRERAQRGASGASTTERPRRVIFVTCCVTEADPNPVTIT